MKIAQVAPLHESVPPRLYGGTERVVSFLTEELVRDGHEVTLFASGDSRTGARLVPGCAQALRLGGCRDPVASHVCMVEEVFRRAADFDVVHFHIDHLHLPLVTREPIPHVTTLHGRLDLPDHAAVFDAFPDAPVVSISEAQRTPLPRANWMGTVHHGLPDDLLTFHPHSQGYLAFLGRISPEKGLDSAIEIARAAGYPLKIAAKVDNADRAYFATEIEHLLSDPSIEFLGEVGDDGKNGLLGGAAGLLFPIDWPEPFGLVMIEAMACGTPVIAFPRGSVPEVMRDGVSGFLVDNVRDAVGAVERLPDLDRRACRMYFEERFSARRMARDYVRIFEDVIAKEGFSSTARHALSAV
jgi:glycosyltransferase involved in cell wall biosynthesis